MLCVCARACSRVRGGACCFPWIAPCLSGGVTNVVTQSVPLASAPGLHLASRRCLFDKVEDLPLLVDKLRTRPDDVDVLLFVLMHSFAPLQLALSLQHLYHRAGSQDPTWDTLRRVCTHTCSLCQ